VAAVLQQCLLLDPRGSHSLEGPTPERALLQSRVDAPQGGRKGATRRGACRRCGLGPEPLVLGTLEQRLQLRKPRGRAFRVYGVRASRLHPLATPSSPSVIFLHLGLCVVWIARRHEQSPLVPLARQALQRSNSATKLKRKTFPPPLRSPSSTRSAGLPPKEAPSAKARR
jgi:hypothetical protein